jgi:hypothetical protein
MPRFKNRTDGLRAAKKTKVDGMTFDSAAEARVYGELKLRQHARGADQVINLRCQTRWPLHAKGGGLVGHYISDFDYNEGGKMKIIDVKPKGFMTDLAKWKIKHFNREYAPLEVEIYET